MKIVEKNLDPFRPTLAPASLDAQAKLYEIPHENDE
jgi:hypothetical protein